MKTFEELPIRLQNKLIDKLIEKKKDAIDGWSYPTKELKKTDDKTKARYLLETFIDSPNNHKALIGL